jgi:hypothetical protein
VRITKNLSSLTKMYKEKDWYWFIEFFLATGWRRLALLQIRYNSESARWLQRSTACTNTVDERNCTASYSFSKACTLQRTLSCVEKYDTIFPPWRMKSTMHCNALQPVVWGYIKGTEVWEAYSVLSMVLFKDLIFFFCQIIAAIGALLTHSAP